jgi:hypothetical protein
VSDFVAACVGDSQALGCAADANIDEAVQAFAEDDLEAQKALD